MKRIFITFLLLFMTNATVLATPDYDYSQDTAKVVVYGVEEAKYNKELYDRLDKEFVDKYFDEHGAKPGLTPNSYAIEVGQAFLEQRKIYNY